MDKTSGSQRSAPILFLHGDFGDGFDAWGSTCDRIGRRFCSIVIDRPGVHEELRPHRRFTFAGDAAYVQDIAEVLRLESYHLVGHSYGALIALNVAIRNPRRVRSLHLVEPPLLALRPDDPSVLAMDRRVREIQRDYWEHGDQFTTDAFFSMLGAEHVTKRLRETLDWETFAAHAGRFARSEPAGDFPVRQLDRLPNSLAIGLYTGGRSHPALRTITQGLGEKMAGARLIDIPDAGHAVQMAGMEFVDQLLDVVESAEQSWRN